MSAGDNSQISAIINSTAAASAFQTPQYPRHMSSPPNARRFPHSAGSSPLRSGSRANPRTSSNSIFPSAHSTASLRQPQSRQTLSRLNPRASVGLCKFRDRDQRAVPVTPPHHDDSDNRVPAPQDGRNHPPVLAPRKRFMLLGGDKLAHRRLGPLQCFPSSSAMTARTPNPSWAARSSSTPASAWLLERPKPAEAA